MSYAVVLGPLTIADIRRLLAVVLHPARTLTHALAVCRWRLQHQTHARHIRYSENAYNTLRG